MFLVIIGLLPILANGQSDTLVLASDFTEIQANPYFSYFSTPEEITADSALQIFNESRAPVKPLDKINFGPIHGYYWFKIVLKNTSQKLQDLNVEIPQPHIYHIKFYRVTKEIVALEHETGIKFDFLTRPLPHRFFEFPVRIQPNESITILLQVYHLNSLTLPIYVRTLASVNQSDYKQNLIWGYWFGFISFCSLFALVASLLLRKSVFLWYFFYMLSSAMYGFAEQGFAFQFVFPKAENIEALVIIQLAVFNFIFLIKFSQGLLETKRYLSKINKLLNVIFYFLLSMLVAGVVLRDLMFKISPVVLPIVNVVTLLGLILLAYCGIKALTTNKLVAIFYLAAYFTLVCAAIFMILNIGFGLTQYFRPNPILISYFLEAVILSVALVILFKQVSSDRTRLLEKVNAQQKEMYTQYINGIEKERSRIAGELHDDVGSRLSYLKQLLQTHSEVSLKTAHQLESLINDVRKLSHDLAPPVAHLSGLIPLVEKLIIETRLAAGVDIKFQLHNFKEVLVSNQIQQMYRILQEALNNIVKHARATRIDVQLFGHEDEVNMTIEDNGVGFNPSEMSDGLGLSQMKIRTESLGGRIEINSHSGKGTLILIKVPIP